MDTAEYDPFARGRFPVGVRTIQAPDPARGRLFPCEIWYLAHAGDTREADSAGEAGRLARPDEARDAAARPGTFPLIVWSHHSGGHRRSATFLCTHLASHGYVVAAMDHSEVVAAELAPRDGETPAERAARIDGVIGGRVPDVRFLLDHLLASAPGTRAGWRRSRTGHDRGMPTLAWPAAGPLPGATAAAIAARCPAGSFPRAARRNPAG